MKQEGLTQKKNNSDQDPIGLQRGKGKRRVTLRAGASEPSSARTHLNKENVFILFRKRRVILRKVGP